MHDEVVALSRFAVAIRSPVDYEDLTKDDQRAAARIALSVVNWAERVTQPS